MNASANSINPLLINHTVKPERILRILIVLFVSFLSPLVGCFSAVVLFSDGLATESSIFMLGSMLVLVFGFGAANRGLWSDTIHYLKFFRAIGNPAELMTQSIVGLSSLDLGFAVLSLVVKLVFRDPDVILLTLTLLVSFWFFVAYRSLLKRDALFALLWFFVSFTFFFLVGNQIRQGFAAAIGLSSISAAISSKTKRAYWLSALAATFHFTALIFFPLVWAIADTSRKPRRPMVLIGITLMLGSVLFAVVESIPESNLWFSKAVGYLSRREAKGLFSMTIGRSVFVGAVVFAVSVVSDRYKIDQKTRKVLWAYFFLLTLELIFFSAREVSNRFANYKLVIEPIVFVLLIQLWKERRMLRTVFWSASFVFLLYVLTFPGSAFFGGYGTRAVTLPIWRVITMSGIGGI